AGGGVRGDVERVFQDAPGEGLNVWLRFFGTGFIRESNISVDRHTSDVPASSRMNSLPQDVLQ
ncbi:hypothetical protein ACCD10_25855, partial [Pseudomonas sp. Pseusp122]|uniref:hypothetical protein n=1 Tax=Pseudomonas sp. Pseusp122 TaxID=3243009 RepID=UPI0039B003E2